MNRTDIAGRIVGRLDAESGRMAAESRQSGRIGSTWVDDLLPPELAHEICERFPRQTV